MAPLTRGFQTLNVRRMSSGPALGTHLLVDTPRQVTDVSFCASHATPQRYHRRTEPSARHFNAYPENNHSRCTSVHRTSRYECDQHKLLARSLLKAVDVGLLPFLLCSAPTPLDSAWVTTRHPLGSSSSWHALHNRQVLSRPMAVNIRHLLCNVDSLETHIAIRGP